MSCEKAPRVRVKKHKNSFPRVIHGGSLSILSREIFYRFKSMQIIVSLLLRDILNNFCSYNIATCVKRALVTFRFTMSFVTYFLGVFYTPFNYDLRSHIKPYMHMKYTYQVWWQVKGSKHNSHCSSYHHSRKSHFVKFQKFDIKHEDLLGYGFQ